MIRFSHTLFALPFALLAAAMAWAANPRAGRRCFRWLDLLGILVCMAAARSAAMAFNRLADRRLDALNPRTQMRHLPTGAAERRRRGGLHRLLAGVFVAGTLLFLPRNWIPLAASRAALGVPLRLQLREAVHAALAPVAGGGPGPGAAGGLGGHPARKSPGRRWSWPRR